MSDPVIPIPPLHDRHLAEVVAAALELPPTERADFVAAQLGANDTLQREAFSLIEASLTAGDFFSGVTPDGVAARVAVRLFQPALDELPGTVIGPYRIMEKIGEGGFGTVFLAEQFHPIRRQVALKIIKLGMDTRQVIARFEQERQALAMMEHPGIAAVFDAGTTKTGRPYFVMELVHGESITTYCDSSALTIRRRLGLFIEVCNAVQHAHLKGVIHRDLKPRNILVTFPASEHNPGSASAPLSAGSVKIIDFGIAKAVAGKLADETLVTEASQFIGTPEYVSPEQVSRDPGGVDTRSDIYSLGVVLYELLSGLTPLAAAGLRTGSVADIQVFIMTAEPPPPSACVVATLERTRAVAGARGMHPSRLAASLRRDLDWITLRCLEIDPARRYQTAQALALDVARHLRAEPVEAAPPSLAYRAAKFGRRNRASVILSSVIAIGLLVALAGTSFGLAQARRERHIAQVQADRAERTADFLKTTIGGVGPGVALGRDTELLRGLMESAAARIAAGEMAANPEAEIELQLTIGITQSELGEGVPAVATLTAARDAAKRLWDGDHPMTAACIDALGHATGFWGQYETSKALIQEGFEMRRRLFPGDHPDVASSINNLGWIAAGRHQLDEAEQRYREALDMRRRLSGGHDDPLLAQSLHNVGALLDARGMNDDSEPMLRESLEMYHRLYPREHPSVANGMYALAITLSRRGINSEAEALFREALVIRRVLYKADHPLVQQSIYHLAKLVLSSRPHSQSDGLALIEEGMAMSVRKSGPSEARKWQSLLLDWHTTRGEHALAEPIARALLTATIEQIGTEPSARLARAMAALGSVLLALDRLEEAERHLSTALEMRKKTYRKEHTDIATTMANLAECLHKRGRRNEALALARDASAMAARTAAPTQPVRRRIETILAELEGAPPPDLAPHP